MLCVIDGGHCTCQPEDGVLCHALAALRSELAAERDKVRTLREIVNLVFSIPHMTDAQLEELRANCRAAIDPTPNDSAERDQPSKS
jgi:hypothetical protein